MTTVEGYGIRTSKMWVFRVDHNTGDIDLEMLVLILHYRKIKGISQFINNCYDTFDCEEILQADICVK